MIAKVSVIIFMWILICILNFLMKKNQPESDWYFYYSMIDGIIFTIILMYLIFH